MTFVLLHRSCNHRVVKCPSDCLRLCFKTSVRMKKNSPDLWKYLLLVLYFTSPPSCQHPSPQLVRAGQRCSRGYHSDLPWLKMSQLCVTRKPDFQFFNLDTVESFGVIGHRQFMSVKTACFCHRQAQIFSDWRVFLQWQTFCQRTGWSS